VPFWVAVLLGFGIVARTTRFLNWDTLAAPLREWVMLRAGGTSKRYKLITCCWCASVWVSAPVSAGIAFVYSGLSWPYSWLAFLGLWLGYSWVYSLIAINLDGGE
jgi:hypothetical protein